MELIGARTIGLPFFLGRDNLKRDFLYFDKLYFDKAEINFYTDRETRWHKLWGKIMKIDFKESLNFKLGELDFLQEKEILVSVDSSFNDTVIVNLNRNNKNYPDMIFSTRGTLMETLGYQHYDFLEGKSIDHSLNNRNWILSFLLNKAHGIRSIPVLQGNNPFQNDNLSKKESILELVLNNIPIIGDNVSWEQIIDFKNDPDSKRKFLALRNWMIDISNSNYSILEITEKFDYLMSEYRHHLKRHRIDTKSGVFKNFITTSGEVLENIAKLKFGKLANFPFEIFERRVNIESTAPGKELGFLYDVNKKFKK